MQRNSGNLQQLEEFMLDLPDNDEAMLIDELDGFIASSRTMKTAMQESPNDEGDSAWA